MVHSPDDDRVVVAERSDSADEFSQGRIHFAVDFEHNVVLAKCRPKMIKILVINVK